MQDPLMMRSAEYGLHGSALLCDVHISPTTLSIARQIALLKRESTGRYLAFALEGWNSVMG